MEQSAATGSHPPAKVNRPALVLLTVAGCVIGLAPVILWLGRPWLFLVFAGEAGIVAARFVRKFKSAATDLPSRQEYLLGGLGTVTYAAMTGLLFFLFWFLIWEAIRFLALLAGLVGLDWHPNARSGAFWSSLVVAVMACGMYAYLATRTLAEQLYPKTAGLRSAFYGLLARRGGQALRTYWLGGLLFVAVAVLIAVLDGFRTGFYVFLQLGLFAAASPLAGLGDETTSPATGYAVRAIHTLLEAVGYQVSPSPRTGDPAFDPMLACVDLLAWDSERTIPVQVKTRDRRILYVDSKRRKADSEPQGVDWTEASTLKMVATLIGNGSTGLGVPLRVEPLLVLVDLPPDESLRAFAREQALHLAEVDMATVDATSRTVDADELRGLAGRVLSLAAAAPQARTELEGGQPT